MKTGISLLIALVMVCSSPTSFAGVAETTGVRKSLELTRTADQQFKLEYCTDTRSLQNRDCVDGGTYNRQQILQVIEKLTEDRTLLSRAVDYAINIGGAFFFGSMALTAVFGNPASQQVSPAATIPALVVTLGSVIYGVYRSRTLHAAEHRIHQGALDNLLYFVNSSSYEEETLRVPAYWHLSPAEVVPIVVAK